MEYGCIGEKLTHSFSKIIHSKIADYNYELKEIEAQDLDGFMKTADFKAINVTIPYKQAVIPYLYEISDTARKIGAVNTVVNRDGKLYGYNTDYEGMRALIKRQGANLSEKKVLVLGSGGTSKTAVAVAESLGAKEVYRVSRSGNDGAVTYDCALENHSDAEAIINTTPCGMYPNIGGTAIDITLFPNLESVTDAVYNPLSSALVTEAKEKGINAVGGLYMLVAQAVFACEKFTGKSIPPSVTDSVYKEILLDKKNIVLTGMPGCGKTTIGKAVAKDTGKVFIDTDDEVVKKAGMSIPEIFQKFGEKKFREIESQVIKEVSAKQSAVIATGGGAVLNPLNVSFLKENGMIVFIDRPIDDLVTTDDRPLSSNRELLEQRYKERYGIYKSSAQTEIKAVKNLSTNINAVKEAFLNENFGD
ncbi:MAG: shikimate kinase [Acutalibacteraceae bacterium]|nr:shikimate kinase [Acutalibacteraceae bacterium]